MKTVDEFLSVQIGTAIMSGLVSLCLTMYILLRERDNWHGDEAMISMATLFIGVVAFGAVTAQLVSAARLNNMVCWHVSDSVDLLCTCRIKPINCFVAFVVK